MANDFSGDSRCVALWRFENDLTDSKGGNDLTGSGGPTFDSVNKKEESYAIDFERDFSQYAYIDDASLDGAFPLKSGTSNKKFTICLWFKAESLGAAFSYLTLFNKWVSNTGLSIDYYNYTNSWLRLVWNNTGWSLGNISTGRWYHLGVSYDDDPNHLIVRLWDDTAQAVIVEWMVRNTAPGITVNSTRVGVGANAAANSNFWDGLIDEVVVFNDCLSAAEIDKIRAGTFTGPETSLVVSQNLAQIEYQERATGLYVFQSMAQVEYTVSTDPTYHRIFPAPPAERLLQSQAGKRKFPVVV